jgi:hypothetical protein
MSDGHRSVLEVPELKSFLLRHRKRITFVRIESAGRVVLRLIDTVTYHVLLEIHHPRQSFLNRRVRIS